MRSKQCLTKRRPRAQIVLRQMRVELVLTRVRDETVRRLFVAHGLVAPSAEDDDGFSYCRSFPTLSDGEQYAEDRWAARRGWFA